MRSPVFVGLHPGNDRFKPQSNPAKYGSPHAEEQYESDGYAKQPFQDADEDGFQRAVLAGAYLLLSPQSELFRLAGQDEPLHCANS